MKLNNFTYLYSKPLGNHTLKITKKIPGNLLKKLEKSWNFVSPKKWEPCKCTSIENKSVFPHTDLNTVEHIVLKNAYNNI